MSRATDRDAIRASPRTVDLRELIAEHARAAGVRRVSTSRVMHAMRQRSILSHRAGDTGTTSHDRDMQNRCHPDARSERRDRVRRAGPPLLLAALGEASRRGCARLTRCTPVYLIAARPAWPQSEMWGRSPHIFLLLDDFLDEM